MITCLGCAVTILSSFSAFVLPPRFLANKASGYGVMGTGLGASFGGRFGYSSLLAVFLDCLVSGCFMVFQCWNPNKKTVNHCSGFCKVPLAYPSRFSLTLAHIAATNTKLSVSLTLSLGGPHREMHHTAKSWHTTSQTPSYPGAYNTQERFWKIKFRVVPLTFLCDG